MSDEMTTPDVNPSELIPGDWLVVDLVEGDEDSDLPEAEELHEQLQSLDEDDIEVWCHNCHNFVNYDFEDQCVSCEHSTKEARESTQSRERVLKERLARKKRELDAATDSGIEEAIQIKMGHLLEALKAVSD